MVFSVEDKHSAEPVVDRRSAAVMVAEPVEDRRSAAIRHAEDTDARGIPPRGAGTDAARPLGPGRVRLLCCRLWKRLVVNMTSSRPTDNE